MINKELTSFDGKQTIFEQLKAVDENGNEYWTARKLSEILDYADFRNFLAVIGKAKEACINSGQDPVYHFVDFNEMIEIGKGGKRQVENVKLSRYACYLIVQNADPSKEVVALGQTYFAVQTRLQELQQMDEYSRLSTDSEKRLFLRDELRKHNVQLAGPKICQLRTVSKNWNKREINKIKPTSKQIERANCRLTKKRIEGHFVSKFA